MSTEELLKPRYKAIASYPDSQFPLNKIIEMEIVSNASMYHFGNNRWEYECWFMDYPHLFRKLDWWEERKLEDMPEYVKRPPEMKFLSNTVFKIDSWDETASIGWCSDHCINVRVDQCIPATKEEYDNQ